MRFPSVLTFMPLVLLCSGCAARGGNDIAPPGRIWTRTVEQLCDGDRDIVWKAVFRTLSGYSLKQRDLVAGIVVTEWKPTIVPHDLLGPAGAVPVQESSDTSPGYTRVPPRWVKINFLVKKRLMVSVVEKENGKTMLSITRQMQVTYFDGPKGSMNPSAYEFLRKDFDTEEEVNTIMRNIVDILQVLGNSKFEKNRTHNILSKSTKIPY